MSKLVEVQPRKLSWSFAGTRRHWFAGSPALTHLLNAYTLLVPDNEKYYIRTLSSCLDRVRSPRLKASLHAFMRQESLHGIAHQRYWQTLEAHGVDATGYVKAVNFFLYRMCEPLQPLRLKVSIVAAIEYLNAMWAHIFLSDDLLHAADDELRKLFHWHFAEEIEHKAVAYDVLDEVFPGYWTRIAGACIAMPMFYLLVSIGLASLLRADREARGRGALRDLRRLLFAQGFLRKNLQHIKRYLRRDFAPWDLDDYALAQAALRTAQPATTGETPIPLPARSA